MNNAVDSSSCLTKDQLVGFYKNNLSQQETKRVEEHLEQCQSCSEALKGLGYLADVDRLDDHLNALQKRVAGRLDQGGLKSYKRYAIAAILVLAVSVLTFFVVVPPDDTVLFKKYYEVYPNTQPVFRGDEATYPLNVAMLYYEQKKYLQADAILADILQSDQGNVTAKFYAGLTRLSLNDIGLAEHYMESILVEEHTDEAEHAMWYLALIRLKKGDRMRAIRLLESLSANGGPYSDRSASLLRDMSR
jgi:hypothetical protein